MLFTPRQPGAEVQRDWSLGVMETAKTAVAIHAPVSARVVAFNPAVVEDVGLVARDPYGAGWLFRVQPLAWAEERPALLDAASYAGWAVPRLASLKAKPITDQFDEDLSVDPHRGY
jgi:glycine cleavage system H protein